MYFTKSISANIMLRSLLSTYLEINAQASRMTHATYDIQGDSGPSLWAMLFFVIMMLAIWGLGRDVEMSYAPQPSHVVSTR